MNSVHPEGRKCRAIADWNNPTLTATGARHSERNGAQRSGVEESPQWFCLRKWRFLDPSTLPLVAGQASLRSLGMTQIGNRVIFRGDNLAIEQLYLPILHFQHDPRWVIPGQLWLDLGRTYFSAMTGLLP